VGEGGNTRVEQVEVGGDVYSVYTHSYLGLGQVHILGVHV